MIWWRSFTNWTEVVGPVADACKQCGSEQRLLVDLLQKQKLYSVVPLGTSHDYRLLCQCGKAERVMNPVRMRRVRAEAISRAPELADHN